MSAAGPGPNASPWIILHGGEPVTCPECRCHACKVEWLETPPKFLTAVAAVIIGKLTRYTCTRGHTWTGPRERHLP